MPHLFRLGSNHPSLARPFFWLSANNVVGGPHRLFRMGANPCGLRLFRFGAVTATNYLVDEFGDYLLAAVPDDRLIAS